MMTLFNRLSIAVLGLIYSTSSIAESSGNLVYAPVLDIISSAPIPTLSETMLIVLSLLIVAVAFRVNQQNNSNKLMLMLLAVLGTGAIITATNGMNIISDVYADGGSGGGVPIPLPSRTGGQVPILENQLSIYENTSGRNQRVTDINRPVNCPNTDAGLIQGVARCNVGTVIPTTAQGMCYVDCRLLQANTSLNTNSG